MKKTVFITGTSSGLGKESVRLFAAQGWNVAATMRTPEKETELNKLPNVQLFKLDITDLAQVNQAVNDAIAAFGQIDVVVNNAGMGTYGALELAKETDIDWQFNVNTRGAINIIRAFLPHFREKGIGKFINISSFMGVTTAVPLGSLYNMSKFALEGLTEGLYYELKPLNISLHLVEQGGSTDNNFFNNIVWNTNPDITVYDEQTAKLKSLMTSTEGVHRDETAVLAIAVYNIASGKNTQFRTLVGDVAKQLMTLRANVPIEEYMEKMRAMF